MASQGSDKLRDILAAAKEKSLAAQAAAAAGVAGAPAATNRVEALLDRNEVLPDPRALARLYRDKTLVERLPDDEEHAVGPAPGAPVTGTAIYSPPVAPPVRPVEAPEPEPRRPPLSPTQIREVMSELQAQFPSGTYQTFEARPLPDDVIPTSEDPDGMAAEPIEEPREIFYMLGAVLALVIIVVFVLLALNGPLRYRPPAGRATPGPSASASKK